MTLSIPPIYRVKDSGNSHIFTTPMATAAAIDRVVHHSDILDGGVNSHPNEAQRERLAALESSESSDQDEANDDDVATQRRKSNSLTSPATGLTQPSNGGRQRR